MNDSFESGFMFAMFVLETVSGKVSQDELATVLKEIRNGDRTLSPSPPDAITAIEEDYGRQLPENLRESVRKLLGDRAKTRENERIAASRILTMMGME
jgi:hypothetical protein